MRNKLSARLVVVIGFVAVASFASAASGVTLKSGTYKLSPGRGHYERTGKIASDVGELSVSLIDRDDNGVFGDSPFDKQGRIRYSDHIMVGTPEALEKSRGVNLSFGFASPYGGKLYKLEVSPAGDTLTIQPYTGKAGTVVFDISDVHGQKAKCLGLYMKGPIGILHIDPNEELRLPVGKYTIDTVTFQPNPKWVFSTRSKRTFDVAENKTTTLSFGGPISVGFGSGVYRQFRSGTTTIIKPLALLNGDSVMHAYGSIRIDLLDDTGSARASATEASFTSDPMAVSNGTRYTLKFAIPQDCKPGRYTLSAVFNIRGYATPAIGTQSIQVE